VLRRQPAAGTTRPSAPRRGKAVPADGGNHRHSVPHTARYRRLKLYRRRHSPTGNAPKIRANNFFIFFSTKPKKGSPQTRGLWTAPFLRPQWRMWKTIRGQHFTDVLSRETPIDIRVMSRNVGNLIRIKSISCPRGLISAHKDRQMLCTRGFTLSYRGPAGCRSLFSVGWRGLKNI
jgi:hypothetical protein